MRGGGGGEKRGVFATDSTVELNFLVEVFNTEAGDDITGYERHNGTTWSEKNEREPARLWVEENLKQRHPQSHLAEALPRHGN